MVPVALSIFGVLNEVVVSYFDLVESCAVLKGKPYFREPEGPASLTYD